MLKKILTIVFVLFALQAHAFDGQKPFNYYAENQNLTEVLSAFARAHNLIPNFSEGLTGTLSGRFENIPSQSFMESMREAFGVAWFELGSTITFYNQSEVQKIFISSNVIPAYELVNMLKAASIVSPALPIEIMPNSDMLVVSGPATYLQQVQSAIVAFESAQMTNFTMEVFPLQHAWADDITVNSMDSQVTIPGVATILQAMVSGSNVTASQVVQLPSAQESLSGQGLSAVGQPQAPATSASIAPTSLNPVEAQAQGMVSIIADPRVNSVIITDAAYRMNYYREVIADLDRPVQLVEIHAAIVDIDSDYNSSLGIDFEGFAEIGDFDLSAGTGDLGGIPDTGLSFSTLYTNGIDTFLAAVEALAQNNEARILGKPSVLTMDNVQATLENTTTYYIEVAGNEASDLFKVEAGTVLRVTPHIITSPDGTNSIKLVVSVQDNQENNDSTAAVGALPPIKQTIINTQAIVNEGQSLLIGGYYYETANEGESGIPGLMDIPLLGGLFRNSTTNTQRMERLILITPRIVSLDETYEIPPQADESSFSRSPTQANYVDRVPQPTPSSGCSRQPSPQY